MPLNDMLCRTAKPKDKSYQLTDGEGLYLLINPNGSKYWRIKYHIHRTVRRMAIGVYPKVSLLEARQHKDKIRADLKNGFDPALIRLETKQTACFAASQTFESIAREWHAKNVDSWDARYAATVLYRLEKYAFADIGDYPIHLLKPIIILACLQKIEKTAPEMARRVKQLCSHICKYAIATDRLTLDLTDGIECALKRIKRGHFASINIDELPKLLIALHEHKARLYRQTYLAIRLMLLTAVRTSELLEAKWSEIDLDKALWVIPAERMKMKHPHLVPLSTQSITIIAELKEMNGKREFLFPSIPRPRNPMSKGTILMALKRMGYSKRMTGHGFRSLFLGVVKEKLNYSHEVADRQLAHVPKSGNGRAYDRATFLPQRTEMMQSFANKIDEIYIEAINKHGIHSLCN